MFPQQAFLRHGVQFCSAAEEFFFACGLFPKPSLNGPFVAPEASRPAIYREIYLGLTQFPNGILGKVFYNADRFTSEGMEVFIRHFREVIQAISVDPDVTV